MRAVESFQNQPEPSLNIPKVLDPKPVGDSDPTPYAPPSNATLAPPPGQMASVNSYPYEDPEMKKAPMKTLANSVETLKGFFSNEAPGLTKSGDPAVQLPMETARSDLRRLEDEVSVLKRNPGVESSLTIGDLNGINANLGYLQKKWRLSANAEVPIEGFQSGGSGSNSGSNAGSNPNSGSNTNPINLQQLLALKVSIASFIKQLQSTGTTSPVTLKRIDTLKFLLQRVSDLVKQVESGVLLESKIPVTVDDYTAFLPFVDPNNMSISQNHPLPTLLNNLDANPGLANLFPAYFANDVSGAQLAQQLFQKYASTLFNDMSYDVTINLGKKSESDRALTTELSQALANGMLGGNKTVQVADSGDTHEAGPASSGGQFTDTIHNLMGSSPSVQPTGKYGTPAMLDWKQRSADICQQISKRGLNPYDFGCLQDPDDVEANFSYRGYAKMVCSRLSTVYDPGVPEMCGCPPATWSGWRP